MSNEPDWIPPADPDPHAIGREAYADHRAGRHRTALAKRLWYHRHALEYEPHLSAVRLSFAISAWRDLARDYPPALQALSAERAAAERSVLEDPTDWESFHDFVSLNDQLQERSRTAAVFAEIHARDRAVAARLYGVAESSLISAGRDDLCEPFLEPEKRLRDAAHSYDLQRRFETEIGPKLTGKMPPPTARRFYLCDVGILLTLLARLGRRPEAEALAPRVREVVEGDDVEIVIAMALEGRFPPSATRD